MTKFRLVQMQHGDGDLAERVTEALEREINKEEKDEYEFYSLTFIGLDKSATTPQFVAAFRRVPSTSTLSSTAK